MPPSMVANDSGISVSAGLRLALMAACISTGINNASAATLFITADKPAAIPDMAAMWVCSDCENRLTCLATSSITPELESPLLTISTSAIMMVAGWPNPENAWSFGTTPRTRAAVRAINATRS